MERDKINKERLAIIHQVAQMITNLTLEPYVLSDDDIQLVNLNTIEAGNRMIESMVQEMRKSIEDTNQD